MYVVSVALSSIYTISYTIYMKQKYIFHRKRLCEHWQLPLTGSLFGTMEVGERSGLTPGHDGALVAGKVSQVPGGRPYLDSSTSNNLLRSLSVIPRARMTAALTANSIMACIKSVALKLKP